MTPHEQHVLDSFLQRLTAAHGVAKDPQADAAIRAALDRQPDAPYLLVQRTLLLEQALEKANARIAELERTADGRGDPGGAGFLHGGLEPGFGRAPTSPGLIGAAVAPAASYGAASPAPAAYAPAPAPAGWRERLFGGGAAAPQQAAPAAARSGPSFLGTAASAAAGVAGGMFLYNGIEHLMQDRAGGHQASSLLDNAPGPGNAPVVEEVTNNNFFDDRAGDDARLAAADDGGGWSDDGGGDFLGDDGDLLA